MVPASSLSSNGFSAARRCGEPRFFTARSGRSPLASWSAVAALTLCSLVGLAAAGCSGTGLVQFVSVHKSEIDPPATTVWQFDAQRCYWWLDEAGELNIALTCTRDNLLLGRFGHVEFEMSFVLGDPPAGSGRNYTITLRETRSVFRTAMQDMRLASNAGIVGVTMRNDGTLRGSFRVWLNPLANTASLSFLPQQNGPLLCFGTLQPVKDEVRGRQIRARCEAGGWFRPPRKPPTATQPATTQPAASQGTTMPATEGP